MPINTKKLTERRSELLASMEEMVKLCETETRAFNEEELEKYTKTLEEIRSIDSTLDAFEETNKLKKVETRAAGSEHTHTQEEAGDPCI